MPDLRAYLAEKKAEVEPELRKALGKEFVSNQRLRGAMSHITLAGGKRLRPIYVYLIADCLEPGLGPKTLPFGCSMELVHNFTLIHDDLMDNAELRHGVKATHLSFDDNTAINAGDSLFARAFQLASTVDVSPEHVVTLMRELAVMVILIAEGQQSDLDFASRQQVEEEEYIAMVENKTARMFQYGARAAGIIAGRDQDTIRDLDEMGRTLGIGFQIWDDVLDLRASEELLGKPQGGDIREGKRTLIMIHAKKNGGDKWGKVEAVLGREDASQAEVANVIDVLEDIGSLDYAAGMAKDYIATAQAKLNRVFEDGDNKEMLKSLIDFLITREF